MHLFERITKITSMKLFFNCQLVVFLFTKQYHISALLPVCASVAISTTFRLCNSNAYTANSHKHLRYYVFYLRGRLPSISSIFTVEPPAISYALNFYAINIYLPAATFTILCDFHCTFQAFDNFNSSHPQVLAILEGLALM